MSIRLKFLLALAGIAIGLLTVLTANVHFWSSALSGVLIVPLWETFAGTPCAAEPAPSKDLWSDDEYRWWDDDRHRDLFKSSDPSHISNGGSNVLEWSGW